VQQIEVIEFEHKYAAEGVDTQTDSPEDRTDTASIHKHIVIRGMWTDRHLFVLCSKQDLQRAGVSL